MKTPIYDFLLSYSRSDTVRMHMPGHKGHGVLGEALDITEISGADSLFEASGIIRESELSASELFGAETYYSTEGSSLAIRAMLYLAARHAVECGKAPLIWAGRNAHKVFLSAAALIDFDIEWLTPEGGSYLSSRITAEYLENKLSQSEIIPTAVSVTSPDYLGNTVDMAALAEVCHRFGVLLLVDAAHGSYLRFLTPSLFPTDLFADCAVSSAHKTLPTLTGGAYLHINRGAPKVFSQHAKSALSLFASTSPSYLIMASLDRTNAYLSDGYAAKLSTFVGKIEEIKKKLSSVGYTLIGDEPMKITISTKSYGYRGYELCELLLSRGVSPEFSDPDYLVLMPTPETCEGELDRLYDVLCSIPKRDEITDLPPSFKMPRRAVSPREAIFAPSVVLPATECVGKTLGAVTVGCPPAVPIIVSGEVIEEEHIDAFKYYGIEKIEVLVK